MFRKRLLSEWKINKPYFVSYSKNQEDNVTNQNI